MKKNLFKPIKVGGATALIGLTSFLSYGIGLLRDRIIAKNFGTSQATDIYNASFVIPDMLFNLFIAGALSAAFLPIFTESLIKNKAKAHKIADTMLTTATLFIGILATISFIFMPQIIPAVFSKTSIEQQTKIIFMTRLMLPSAILFAISNTMGNILMSYKHFFAYAISPVLYNLGIIIGISTLSGKLGIISAGIGVLIGAMLHMTIRLIDVIHTDYKFKPSVKIKDKDFQKILKLMIPKSISLLGWQINIWLFTKVGLSIVEGGVAAFNYARNIQSFAVSIFGITFATAIFPTLSAEASKKGHGDFTKNIQKTMQRILFFTIPASIGLFILAKPIVTIILAGGEFNQKSIDMTAKILMFFAISIPFESLSHILSRSFYALKNTKTPMIINIISMTIIGTGTILIAPKYGIQWFSISFTVGFITYVILSIILLKKHLKNFRIKIFIKSITKTMLASIIMTIGILIIDKLNLPINTILIYLIEIIAGAGIYFLTAIALKAEEISSISYITNRIFKKT